MCKGRLSLGLNQQAFADEATKAVERALEVREF